MVPISKNEIKKKHQTVNFVDTKRLSYIYHCTVAFKRYERRQDSIIQTILKNLIKIVTES